MTTITSVIYQGPNGGYSIVAKGCPVFAFGKTLDIVQSRWVKACHAYFGNPKEAIAVTSGSAFEQHIFA